MHHKWLSRRTFNASLLGLATPIVALPAETARAKGVYWDTSTSSTTLGIRVNVLFLDQDSDVSGKLVSSTYPFRSGDRFKLQFSLKTESYVYILNRTFAGDPDKLFRARDLGPGEVTGPSPSSEKVGQCYSLLSPLPGRRPSRYPANRWFVAGGGSGMVLRFNEQSGLERMLFLVSHQRLHLKGLILPDGNADEFDTPLRVLHRDLAEWSASTVVDDGATGAKGIEVESSDVAARDGRTLLLYLDLKHYPR